MRYAPRRAHVPYWWLLATAAAAFIAIGPIVAAVVASLGGGGPASAFASAPSGDYAVMARAESTADVIIAVGTGGEPREIARVPHLPGYVSYGAVSPGNDRLALVVADGGTQARPVASLVTVDLLTGEATRVATNIDYLQTPVWSRDGVSIVLSRTTAEGPRANVRLARVSLGGTEEALVEATGVLGAYPVGYAKDGRFIHVAVEGRGSVLYRDGREVAVLAPGITRDWRLSDDGSAIAFVETVSEGGVKYFARIVSLVDGVSAQALSAADGGQSLGVAWRPGSGAPTFGAEPSPASAGVGAQALSASGFDVPLAYSNDGRALAVQHWSGSSFAQPGEGSFELVADDGTRRALQGYSRFYGWAVK